MSSTDKKRADMETLPLLMQMYELGQEFIDEEQDPGDESDVTKMTAILADIEALVTVEANEPNEPDADAEEDGLEEKSAPPRADLFRGRFPGEIAISERDEGSGPVLNGHFAVFNQWTEINSSFEGHFLERFAPGAFAKTIAENGDRVRVLFQHGRDPQIGDKVLGSIDTLREDKQGAYYEVPLFDTSYNRDLLPGLRAGSYGASFRFGVVREDFNMDPGVSDHNPAGLPERTVSEARLMEFGPVTFPAYAGATANVRSLTDDFRGVAVERSPLTTEQTPPALAQTDSRDIPSEPEVQNVEEETAAPSHPAEDDVPRRDTRPANDTPTRREPMQPIEQMRARRDEIKAEIETVAAENMGERLDADTQDRWDTLVAEREDLNQRIKATEERLAYVDDMASREGNTIDGASNNATGTGTFVGRRAGRDAPPDNVFDVSAYHGRAGSQEQLGRVYTEGARKAVEGFQYPHERANNDDTSAHIEKLLAQDGLDREMAQRVITFGSPTYRRAFWKSMLNQPLTDEEQRAMAAGAMLEARALTQQGGVTVPLQIDPTVVLSSNGQINPFRQISRIVNTTSYLWQAVTSGGITASYAAETGGASDNTPSLTAPTIQPERAQAFVPFTYEAGQDWGALESEMAREMQDAKDVLEATKFSVGAGHGSNEPQGVLVGAGTVVGTSGNTAFAVADIYGMENALPPRFQPRASWVSSIAMYQKVRQFDTAGGANLWVQLQAENPPELIGYPAYKASTVGTAGSALTSTARWGIFGDFSQFVIVDRIGMQVKLIPDLFGGTAAVHYPTGQSGVYSFWRNSAGVTNSNAFRVGTIT